MNASHNGPEASHAIGETQWHRACILDDVASGTCEVLVSNRVIAIFKTAVGFFATDGMCAHQGGPLAKGQLDGNCVTCPWHGWQYDVTNGNNMLTGKQMLSRYPVELRGSEIWVEVPTP